MQLLERLRMLDHDLGRERPGLHVSALLELEQVAAVAQHRPNGQALQDALGHAPSVRFRDAPQGPRRRT